MSTVRFIYDAYSGGRPVQGEILAANETDALRTLSRKGLTPLRVRAADGSSPAAPRKRARASQSDVAVLLREMGSLLQAGVSVGETLDGLVKAYSTSPLGTGLSAMRQAVVSGGSFLDGLRAADFGLPDYAEAMIASGEAAGTLASALDEAVVQIEYELQLREEIRNALIYPAILVSTGVVVVLIVFIAVVPRFGSLLKGGRAQVPAISRWVIEAGMYVQSHLVELAAVTLSFALVAAVLLSRPGVRQKFWHWGVHFPLLGAWIRETEIGRWASLLGSLLANRVPMLSALALSANSFRLPAMRANIDQAGLAVRRGSSLSEVLEAQAWIPPTRLNLIRVGERSGELPRMLATLGTMQSASAKQRMKRFLIVLEPAAILLIGVVVGFLMVSVMMALTSLNTAPR